MPLKKDDRSETWNWKRAVAWIAFDIDDAPGQNVWEWGIATPQGRDLTPIYQAAFAAVEQLIRAIAAGSLTPIRPDARDLARILRSGRHSQSDLLMDNTDVVAGSSARWILGQPPHPLFQPNKAQSVFWSLEFRRRDILEGWPQECGGTQPNEASALATKRATPSTHSSPLPIGAALTETEIVDSNHALQIVKDERLKAEADGTDYSFMGHRAIARRIAAKLYPNQSMERKGETVYRRMQDLRKKLDCTPGLVPDTWWD
jgi:hypothetical protein